MQVRFNCPTEGCVALIEMEPLPVTGEPITCPRCRTPHAVHVTDALRTENHVDVCPICQCRELFIRKDFPQKAGLLIVVVAAIISFATFRTHFAVSWGVLGAAVLIDLIIYLLIGTVTVCYACRAEFRGAAPDPKHEGFDLARSEKY